ncbi:MAG: helix-turn-helix domain-containing protein [Coprobacillus cateniformis]|uniref:helix-turn-helix domain-containing protein n=1 Tax=Longibaculum muris TaxID=1796628 RepID=UPI003AB3A61A|nr:helix-turn-helix domain-containing protein [Coprobacillus cateniformis]
MISKNLMYLRQIHKLTLEELAERVGVSRQAVAKWENGETIPDLNNCMALAEIYGVTIDDLINHDSKVTGYGIPPKGKHIFGSVTVGERGQIVIPKKAREIFQIQPGTDLLVLGDEQQGIALVKAEVFFAIAKEILDKGGQK